MNAGKNFDVSLSVNEGWPRSNSVLAVNTNRKKNHLTISAVNFKGLTFNPTLYMNVTLLICFHFS